jgi:fumarylacetoacetase
VTCWVHDAEGSGFGPEHLPYGVVTHAGGHPELAVRVGTYALSLARLHDAGLLDDVVPRALRVFGTGSLDGLLARGPDQWDAVRRRLLDIVHDEDSQHLARRALLPLAEVTEHLPWSVADFVDFYASEHHASNVARFVGADDGALPPAWKHQPLGYHGRAGTVVASGTDVRRPVGQSRPPGGTDVPRFGPSRRLDVEAEVAFVVGAPSSGDPVAASAFAEHVFGVVLLGDWSARDLQGFESAPLGPFLGKSFATSVSAWVTPLAALAEARTQPAPQSPEPAAYLADDDPWSLDLTLSFALGRDGTEVVLSRPPFATTYWTPGQLIAHLTVNGATLRSGDLFASGTVSGPDRDQRGCLLELTEGGREDYDAGDLGRVRFLDDGDVVRIGATARGAGGTILSLGDVVGRVTAARGTGARGREEQP